MDKKGRTKEDIVDAIEEKWLSNLRDVRTEPVIEIMVQEHIERWYTIKKEDLSEGEYIDSDGDLSDGLREALYSESFEFRREKYHSNIHILKEEEHE